MNDIEKKLRALASGLFAAGKIDIFIGYGQGTVPGRAAPVFIKKAEDADKLVWNEFCVVNLAAYLPRYFVINPRAKDQKFPRIGIAAKGCDGRSIVGLIKENQVPRENLYIVGLACQGMKEQKNENSIERECCTECRYPAPLIYDELIGEKNNDSKPLSYKRIENFRKKTVQERWQYFQHEMQKCIRCYACRQVCPNCYCKECFTEQTSPKWQSVSNDQPDITFYQMGRLFHQAGRCVDCGSCSFVCPMGIDLRLFLQGLLKDVTDLYGYEAGISLEDDPPLSVFKMDDKQDFITET